MEEATLPTSSVGSAVQMLFHIGIAPSQYALVPYELCTV